jgi:flavin-dependent dehydrogenase
MNVLKIKGSHTAIKSGVEAGNALFKKLTDP